MSNSCHLARNAKSALSDKDIILHIRISTDNAPPGKEASFTDMSSMRYVHMGKNDRIITNERICLNKRESRNINSYI